MFRDQNAGEVAI